MDDDDVAKPDNWKLVLLVGLLLLPQFVDVPTWTLPLVALAFLVLVVRGETQRNINREHLASSDRAFLSARSRADLLETYANRIDESAPAARDAVFHTRRILVYHGVVTLTSLRHLSFGFSAYSFAMVLGCGALLATVAARYYAKKTWLSRGMRSGNLQPAPAHIYESFLVVLQRTGDRFDTPTVRVRAWVAKRSTSALPSVWEDDDSIHLVVPLGFLAIHRTRRELARALIAHEVGHIVQQDTYLWFYAEAAGGGAHVLATVVNVLQIVFAVSAGFYGLAFIAIGLGIQQMRSFGDIVAARLASERMADVAGVLFSERGAYGEALERYLDDAQPSTHESKALRIARVGAYARLIEGGTANE